MSDELSTYDPAYGKRAEFGELARASGRSLNERSAAQIAGAGNLLTKATGHLRAGSTDKADALITRAAAMPYDVREVGSPGLWAASILVYGLVNDHFEECAQDDASWLDVALEVHAESSGPGRAELASTIHGYVLQRDLFELTPDERRRIVAAVGDAPLEADHGDGPDLTVEERADIIRSILSAACALHEGYERAGGA